MSATVIGTLLIVVGIVTNQLEGIFIKRYNMKHSVGGFTFTALISFFSMLFFVITDTGGLQFSVGVVLYGLAAGVLYSSASFLTFVAIGCGPFALSQLILSYGLVFKIVYGLVFLKEPTTLFTYVGLAVLTFSIYLTRAEKFPESKGVSAKWFVCILCAVFGSGMFGVLQKMQQLTFENRVTNEFMIISLGFSAAVLFTVGIIRDGKQLKTILKNGGWYTLGAGMANGITNMTTLAVNTLVPLSFSAPLRSGLKIVIVYLISRILFHETFLVRQKIGVALGAVALILLNIK